jgi:transposase
VSPADGESFSLFLPEVNTEMMNIFLKELSKEYATKEILIVMDQAGWHKARELRIPPNITFEYLPAYSPELNPIEKLWQWLKKEVVHNNIFETLEMLMDVLEKQMRELTLQKYAQICHCSYLRQLN